MVRVMIADDHVLMRRIVRAVIEQESDLEMVAEAADGFEAEQQAAETQPDVILMDLVMPGRDGFEATERVLHCSPHSRVVIFTASDQEQHALHAIQRGAVGYLTKDIQPDDLVAAIRRAAQDELCMSRALAARLLTHLRTLSFNSGDTSQRKQRGEALVHTSMLTGNRKGRRARIHLADENSGQKASQKGRELTSRERQILALMRQGRRNREIADELRIAESTVHKHIQNIFEKLHVRNRSEAIILSHA